MVVCKNCGGEIFHSQGGILTSCPNCGCDTSINGATFVDTAGGIRCARCFKSIKRAPRRKKEAMF